PHGPGSRNSDGGNQQELRRDHVTYLKFFFSVFFLFGRVCPPPPSDNVGDKEECIEEHVGIKLHLVEQEEKKDGVEYSHGPVQNACPGGQRYGDESCQGSEELQIAHRISPDRKKDVVDVEEFQIMFV